MSLVDVVLGLLLLRVAFGVGRAIGRLEGYINAKAAEEPEEDDGDLYVRAQRLAGARGLQ